MNSYEKRKVEREIEEERKSVQDPEILQALAELGPLPEYPDFILKYGTLFNGIIYGKYRPHIFVDGQVHYLKRKQAEQLQSILQRQDFWQYKHKRIVTDHDFSWVRAKEA